MMTLKQQAARERATSALTHYFEVLFKRTAGGGDAPFNSDNRVEIEGIVDDLIKAATPEPEDLQALFRQPR
jgi:hypothetical protein